MTFDYLKANTVIFADRMCESLHDMCGIGFIPVKETIREGAFTTPYTIIMFSGFSGTIEGNYIISFDETTALQIANIYEEGMPAAKIKDLRENFGGLLKETLNIAVGQSIEELEKSFRGLSISPVTVVYGEIEFPNILSCSIAIEGREGKIVCGLSCNLANVKQKG